MKGLLRTAISIALAAFSTLSTQAHSTPQGPLSSLSHPTIQSLEILPRPNSHPRRTTPSLLHSDSFRIALTYESKTYYLHLSPTQHLIHPAARVNYYRPSSIPGGPAVLYKTTPLLPQDVRAYSGYVLDPSTTNARFLEDAAGGLSSSSAPILGWAQITVHKYNPYSPSSEPPLFEGAFSIDGVVHHVLTKENYERHRHPLDAPLDPPNDPADSRLVIFRDSDVLPHESALPETHSCTHDSLSANSPLINPLLSLSHPHSAISLPIKPKHKSNIWSDMISMFENNSHAAPVVKRDDVQTGGGMNMSSNFIDNIGSGNGCPVDQKIIYMGVGADCNYVQTYGSMQNATQQILNDWNMATALYKSTFNVSLGIVELSIHDPTCPVTPDPSFPWNTACDNTTTLNDRLSSFSAWRGAKGGGDGAGLWHLMSGCPTGSEVGVAWLGTLCDTGSSGTSGEIVSGTAVSTATRTEWQVVAHETGHNFGAIHDCTTGCSTTDGCCSLTPNTCNANGNFIMSPVSIANQSVFSQCTLGNICSLVGTHLNSTCLVSPQADVKTISLQMCGNGIVEAGEDCDPGMGQNSTCCDSATCKFTPGSVCDPLSSSCCQSTCQFAPSSQVCRPALDPQCDVPEFCTGGGAECPPDVTTPDGTSCGSNGLACASGLCTSLSQQCQTVGASMNLTSACPQPETSCQVSCQDPTQSNQCVVLQSYLTSGSPCGYGGKCYNNACQPGSLLDTIKAWYANNLAIAIPVTVVGGTIVLLLLWGLFVWIRRGCRRSKAAQLARVPSSPTMKSYGRSQPNGPPPPQLSAAPGWSSSSSTYRPDYADYQSGGHSRMDSHDSVTPLRSY